MKKIKKYEEQLVEWEKDAPPVGNGHPDFDMLVDVIAQKYRRPIEEVNDNDRHSNEMTFAYNEALADVARICLKNWNTDEEIKKLKELAIENAGWTNNWVNDLWN